MSGLHVLFEVEDGRYAVPAEDVIVMESYTGATRVPGAPVWVAGLVQVRGQVVPVVDLRKRFGLADVPHTLDTRVVVVRDGARTIGLLADRAREVVQLPADAWKPPPDAVQAQADRFIRAVTRTGDRLLMLIDCARVASQEKIDGEGNLAGG